MAVCGLDQTGLTPDDAAKALENAVGQVRKNAIQFQDTFLSENSFQGYYKRHDNTGWATGFFTGELWLAYEVTGDETFAALADKQVNSFYDRILNRVDVDHHDMGFLYSLSCVAGWKLTKNEKARTAAWMAAKQLCSRFQEKGQFIQAWGKMGAKENYRLIIDCLLNLPLLYWASEETLDPCYADIADRHIKTALHVLIRDDGSTHHTYFFDPETGTPLYGKTAQGYNSDSAWARGQAWGIYGTALAYRYTHKEEYIALFTRVADYFLQHLPRAGIPYWDLCFQEGCGEPWDSSAAAIAVCGMLEMAKYLPAELANVYAGKARWILASLIQNCAVIEDTASNGLLLHGTYVKHSNWNHMEERGVDECNLWGDYFYLEALVRVSRPWEHYW